MEEKRTVSSRTEKKNICDYKRRREKKRLSLFLVGNVEFATAYCVDSIFANKVVNEKKIYTFICKIVRSSFCPSTMDWSKDQDNKFFLLPFFSSHSVILLSLLELSRVCLPIWWIMLAYEDEARRMWFSKGLGEFTVLKRLKTHSRTKKNKIMRPTRKAIQIFMMLTRSKLSHSPLKTHYNVA